MLALITGASSGIGREMAIILGKKGYDLIITSRNKVKLEELKRKIIEKYKIDVEIIVADLCDEESVLKLYEQVKNKKIDIFINNAGFGIISDFWETDLKTELNMLKVNDLAMHILFKLILKDMIEREDDNAKNKKYILNVSSLSGFMPGPKMSVYYATKAYILNLTLGVHKELKEKKLDKKISLSVLCSGPIYTNFCDRAGVVFKTKYLASEYVAKYAIDNLFGEKLIIIPGFLNKCGHILSKIVPVKLLMSVVYKIQKKKIPEE